MTGVEPSLVQRRSTRRLFEGVTVGLRELVCVYKSKRKTDSAHQPLIHSPDPRNMLQSAPVRVKILPFCIRHGGGEKKKQNSPNKGINTNIMFLGRHNIYAVLQVAYEREEGFWARLLPDMKQEPRDPVPTISRRGELGVQRTQGRCRGLRLITGFLLWFLLSEAVTPFRRIQGK